MKKVVALFLAFACSSSFAGISGSLVKMNSLSSYSQYGGGDVLVAVDSGPTGCENGFWLSKTDPGFQANLAMLLSAYHAKTPLAIYGLTEQMWAGSAGKFCKLYSVELR